ERARGSREYAEKRVSDGCGEGSAKRVVLVGKLIDSESRVDREMNPSGAGIANFEDGPTGDFAFNIQIPLLRIGIGLPRYRCVHRAAFSRKGERSCVTTRRLNEPAGERI